MLGCKWLSVNKLSLVCFLPLSWVPPKAILKTEDTVFPNTDPHWLVNNIVIFFSDLMKYLPKDPNDFLAVIITARYFA